MTLSSSWPTRFYLLAIVLILHSIFVVNADDHLKPRSVWSRRHRNLDVARRQGPPGGSYPPNGFLSSCESPTCISVHSYTSLPVTEPQFCDAATGFADGNLLSLAALVGARRTDSRTAYPSPIRLTYPNPARPLAAAFLVAKDLFQLSETLA